MAVGVCRGVVEVERKDNGISRTVVVAEKQRFVAFEWFVQFMRSGRPAGAGDP